MHTHRKRTNGRRTGATGSSRAPGRLPGQFGGGAGDGGAGAGVGDAGGEGGRDGGEGEGALGGGGGVVDGGGGGAGGAGGLLHELELELLLADHLEEAVLVERGESVSRRRRKGVVGGYVGTTWASCSCSSSWCSSPRLGVRAWWGSPVAMVGEPPIRGGLVVWKAWPMEVRGSLPCISPGPGREGSFRLMFMTAVDLRRSLLPTCGDALLRLELVEERRESCCCMPALMLAAAANEKDDDRGDGVCRRWVSAVLVKTRDWWGEAFGERDGGRELRSGAMTEYWKDSGVIWKEREEMWSG